ncbi:hypothetical protein [Thiothrix nivea]|uniref:Zinc/iron-chelating domain-containing protein n=1 Tax=Thiothrix nivea (strain ATCC 35100 / DSM 5205 / JP2) TaxID=870187 RepID=A0A656HF84_THINJ|nr:hypothetical protein [Thiothrix nivea]EIJ35588.1 protein of unknown function UPF0153 [Thiothrix nivea DSM 5205]
MDMDCRPGCAACCIAPSISTPIPKHQAGKPAGEPCLHLLPDLRCELFGQESRPKVCNSLRPNVEMCGTERIHALNFLQQLEADTKP